MSRSGSLSGISTTRSANKMLERLCEWSFTSRSRFVRVLLTLLLSPIIIVGAMEEAWLGPDKDRL